MKFTEDRFGLIAAAFCAALAIAGTALAVNQALYLMIHGPPKSSQKIIPPEKAEGWTWSPKTGGWIPPAPPAPKRRPRSEHRPVREFEPSCGPCPPARVALARKDFSSTRKIPNATVRWEYHIHAVIPGETKPPYEVRVYLPARFYEKVDLHPLQNYCVIGPDEGVMKGPARVDFAIDKQREQCYAGMRITTHHPGKRVSVFLSIVPTHKPSVSNLRPEEISVELAELDP